MSELIKVLVVDDHALVRESVSQALRRHAGFEVVGNADNARDAIQMALETQPNVILMDIDMPGMNSFSAAETLRDQLPAAAVIFLSAFLHDHYVDEAMKVEARGYLTKRESTDTLIEALQRVAGGGLYFSPEVQERVVVDETGVHLSREPKSRVSTLTPREVEILRYIAKGLTKKEIAKMMHLSVKTIETHSSNLMGKLGIHDRVALARFAIREGLAEI